MTRPFASGPAFERSTFEKRCAYCGARFAVAVARLPGSDEPAEYACPECGKAYALRAAMQPSVQLIAPRTDGRGDPYQETMF